MQTQDTHQTIQLLPLLLQHGKSFELPIVIVGCKRIILHDLVYRNKSSADLISKCSVVVNGETIRYEKSDNCDKTYRIEGGNNSAYEVHLDPLIDTRFDLEVTCANFDLCGCKQHRFQLNISAVYE